MVRPALYCAGDGFGKRAEDAVLHGCLPVQIGDHITDKFETIVDWDSFTTRIPEADIERVPEILLSYTDAQVRFSIRCPLCSKFSNRLAAQSTFKHLGQLAVQLPSGRAAMHAWSADRSAALCRLRPCRQRWAKCGTGEACSCGCTSPCTSAPQRRSSQHDR